MTSILGISAFYHDSAAALVVDGEIVAAAQEERFTRKKHDPAFPTRAIAYCLQEAGQSARDVDYVVFYEKPLPQVRAAARDVLRLRAERLPQFPDGVAGVAEREDSPAACHSRGTGRGVQGADRLHRSP